MNKLMRQIKSNHGYTIKQVLLTIAIIATCIAFLVPTFIGAGGDDGVTFEGVALYLVLIVGIAIPILWAALYEYTGSLIKVLVGSIMFLVGLLLCYIQFGTIRVELIGLAAVVCGLYTLLSRYPNKGRREEVEFFDDRRYEVSVLEDIVFGAGYGVFYPQIAIILISLIEK